VNPESDAGLLVQNKNLHCDVKIFAKMRKYDVSHGLCGF
jgi:hypothetical protein